VAARAAQRECRRLRLDLQRMTSLLLYAEVI
jgi:hypothetical protein